ncbi:MAG: hypothetical protein VKM34_11145 [Cyanobacteriota bacterium]|nr:hypothetical protein [Cyanobacteriota bacterium]
MSSNPEQKPLVRSLMFLRLIPSHIPIHPSACFSISLGPQAITTNRANRAALALGASLLDPPRQEPFGAEAWLLDPEGNRLLLLVSP